MSEYASQFNRPPFDPAGKLVVRRNGLRHGDETYAAGRDLPRSGLEPRAIAVLWDQGWIDTLPRAADPDDAELERLTAPTPAARPAAQPSRAQPRR